ncbi:chromosome segregation protein Csm1/Pcs1-domain-containing protein [Xylariomycetidae sp. FL0641]|nr:chromosome segregation protein Csm1/Pcs1-domain-containing protein [Xylariomycetidae sp. FL0641]
MPPAKKGRGAAATRQANARPNDAGVGAASRKALNEKETNVQELPTRGRGKKRPANDDLESSHMENRDDSVVEPVAKPKGQRGRPRAVKAMRISEEEDTSMEAPSEAPAPAPSKRGRKPRARTEPTPAEPEIPETQEPSVEIPETQPVDPVDESIEEDDQVEDLPTYNRAGPSSVQRSQLHVPFSASRRPTPASDSELHDPSMRRRIGDLTRKYENLEAKYRDLRELGVKEAERNYDRLKKQGEEKINTANQLIATLKAQLSAQTEMAKESKRLRQQLEASQAEVADLQGQLSSANSSLAEARTETKALSTKLTAARSAETTTTVKVPGSAIKGKSGNNHLIANAEAAAQVAQMKENLYGDLTGLIVCGIKREKNEEVFDCVQTGRNGTLHFKLAIDVEGSEDKYSSDAQFMYLPQLDAARDSELIDTLPDYLVEEITFPRLHAAKFYSRVMKALTERLD